MTNGDAIRQGLVPCETNPHTGGLSRTGDVYHGAARATTGQRKGTLRHVCLDCAKAHHGLQKARPGVLWE